MSGEVLKIQIKLMESVIQNLDTGIVILDREQRVVFWNKLSAKLSRIDSEVARGQTLIQLFPEIIDSRLHRAINGALENGMPTFLSNTLHRFPLPFFVLDHESKEKGRRIEQAIQVQSVEMGESEKYCVLQIHDVTAVVNREMALRLQYREIKAAQDELAQANMALENMANTDYLTAIPNRQYFDAAFPVELKRSSRGTNPGVLLMLDIDYFKRYNDQFGHQAGDDCLKEVAYILKDSLRRAGDLLARYGGEEFIIFLPNTDQKGGEGVAEKLRLSVEKSRSKVFLGKVTISIGLTVIPSGGKIQIPEIIRLADLALYDSKEAGRNRVSERHFS